MMNILFSHSYFYRFDPKQWKNKTPYPPLGTIYAAGWMRENGHSVSLFDVALREHVNDLSDVIEKESYGALVIYDDGFNYLTKMCLTNMREAAFQMAKIASDRGLKVIVCSSDSTDHYEKYLSNGCDYVIKGEGEMTLLALIGSLENGESVSEIEGIAYKDDIGDVVVNDKRPVLKDLDVLAPPAWDLVDIESYRNVWSQGKHRFTLNVATTRGCPYKCNWCAKPIYGNRYNTRSPMKVVDEIEFHITNHQVSKFWMCDDIFGLKPRWVQEFRDELKRRNLSIEYMIQSRADLLLKDDNIQALADSGLKEVWMGAESGSQNILDAMDKGITVEQIRESTRKLQNHNIKAAFFIQFGYLGETKSDIEKTLDLIRDLGPDNIGVSVSYPLPGTVFYDKVKQELTEKANWTDSDDLALMFQNTFNDKYYKTLHRFVHKHFRKHQGLKTIRHLSAEKGGNFKSAVLLPYYLISAFFYKRKLDSLENVN